MSQITTNCPTFEYDVAADWSEILTARAKQVLVHIRSLRGPAEIAFQKDTRPVHGQYFSGLTPANCDYYAGNYRGSDFTCLRQYLVRITNDPTVGHPPDRIADDMYSFGADLVLAIADCDFVWSVNQAVFPPVEKLHRVIRMAVSLFVYFLQIHPYANGNGHMARFLLIAFLARYEVYLSKWPMHPRPQDPPYSELIRMYRLGDRASLERFVLACI